jgi:hypothetical protein
MILVNKDKFSRIKLVSLLVHKRHDSYKLSNDGHNLTKTKLMTEASCQSFRHNATKLSTWRCIWLLGLLYFQVTATKLFINLSVCLLVENWRVLHTVLLLRMCPPHLLHISMPLSLLHKRYKRITFCGRLNLGICTVSGSRIKYRTFQRRMSNI